MEKCYNKRNATLRFLSHSFHVLLQFADARYQGADVEQWAPGKRLN
jgi:hypothetical protein